MKLEVGQKIGIYEVIRLDNYKVEVLHIGYRALGCDNGKGGIIMLNTVNSNFHNMLMYSKREVRKVGSLIVKRLKVPEPPNK